MNILLNQKQNLNKFSNEILNDSKTNINFNNITLCTNIVKINKKFIVEFINETNLQYPTKFKVNNYFYFFKHCKDISLVTFKISNNIYKLYSKHFFNYLVKNKIQTIKGRILSLKKINEKWVFLIGINGYIISVSKNDICLTKQIQYKDKHIEKYFLRKTHFLYDNIIENNDPLKVNISRKKFLNLENNINIEI